MKLEERTRRASRQWRQGERVRVQEKSAVWRSVGEFALFIDTSNLALAPPTDGNSFVPQAAV